jgi:iron complex transport system ATP-binding protein
VQIRRGTRVLVRGLDLDIRARERWAVVGPNGAGKTSLLLTLGGALAADAGSVRLAGVDPAHCSAPRLADARAMLADRWTDPFSAPVVDVVAAARYRFGDDPQAQERARACLQLLGCAALSERDVRSLSRGERQRVALAAALAQEAPLLLLDEPISHQDPRQQGEVLRRLELAGVACVAALHDINAAVSFATHALLLSGSGHWIAGPVCEVLRPQPLAHIFGAEFVEIPFGDRRLLAVAGP